MGISLEKCEPKFRALVAAGEAAAAAARVRRKYHLDVGGIRAAVSPEHAPALGRRSKGKGARKARGGPRYRVDFILYRRQPLDWDNSSGAIKEVQDSMVTAGWLPSDDWDRLEGAAHSEPCATKEEERTVAVLTRIK